MKSGGVYGLLWVVAAAWVVAAPLPAERTVEVESVVTGPPGAWTTNWVAARWNLWTTDHDAARKWSGGAVLRSPPVTADRASPDDGAPPLHVRIPDLPVGRYDISLKGGRAIAVSWDGRTWERKVPGLLADGVVVTNGTLDIWFDDRFSDPSNPGPCYLDTLALQWWPLPAIKSPVVGHAKTRVVERIDRGLIAVPCEAGVYVGWRLLRDDPADLGVHVYRSDGGLEPRRLTARPVRDTTDYLDPAPPRDVDLVYSIRIVRNGVEERAGPSAPAVRFAAKPVEPIVLPLAPSVRFGKCAVGDLDGDGRYDFVVKSPADSIDPYEQYRKRSPGTYAIQAVRSDGTLLWRNDLGWAIEQGTWYSPYVVYDLNGDARAEVAVKIGEGDPRDADGRVRSGEEWLAIWEGTTGRELARAPWPDRTGFGDDLRGYNYASRNQMAIAYLDGKTPCLIVLRGTYTIMKADAWSFDGHQLRRLWTYHSDEAGRRWRGQGAHTTRCADVDGDGRDEVILGSAVLDDNGSPLWCTGLGHPDHMYVGDLMPQRPGLEIYYGIETRQPSNGLCMVDAPTGRILWAWNGPTKHIHSSGLCADICPLHPGVECYGADSTDHKPTGDRWLFNSAGQVLSRDVDMGFGKWSVHWDADLQRELVWGREIVDFQGGPHPVRLANEPLLVADILGDWREEMVVSVPGRLLIYTTTIPAMDRRPTLMQDPFYRLDVAAASMGYTVPPTPSYDIESRAPNLNLTAPAGKRGVVRVVVASPLRHALSGNLRLTATAGNVRPDSLPVHLPAGGRRAWEVNIEPATRGEWVAARLELPDRILESRVRLP